MFGRYWLSGCKTCYSVAMKRILLLFLLLQTLPAQALERRILKEAALGEALQAELYAPTSQALDDAVVRLRVRIQTIQRLIGPQRSELSQALRAAEQKPTPISQELYTLLAKTQDYCLRSQRAFDITSPPLYTLWGFTPDSFSQRIPPPAALKQALARVDCQALDVREVPRTLYLRKPQLQVSLQQLQHGYLLDQVIEPLRAAGVSAAHLQLGAAQYFLGAPPDAQAWKVGIPNPLKPRENFTYIYLKDQALSQIGDYQNYFTHNGIRYSDLLDPRTGFPPKGLKTLVTVHHSAWEAQMLAYTLAHLDEPQTQAFIANQKKLYALRLAENNGLLMPMEYRR